MPEITITAIALHERRALENLLQLYIHDCSEFWAGQKNGELGEDGRFGDYPLDAYFSEADRLALFVRVDGHLAGFALLNSASHLHAPLDRNMAEFFIARKHRRGGVGTKAAHAIFSRYPGRWETAVARKNTNALAFWRNAVARHPLAREVVEYDLTDEGWQGPVIAFRILPC